jgi:hypothetical protein
MTDLDRDAPDAPDPNVGLELDLERVVESPEEEEELPWGNDPSTATWAPMMAEVRKNPSLPSRVTNTASPDLRPELALSIPRNPTHWQRRALHPSHQRTLPHLAEIQRALRESLLAPLPRYRLFSHPLRVRSRAVVPGHPERVGQDI